MSFVICFLYDGSVVNSDSALKAMQVRRKFYCCAFTSTSSGKFSDLLVTYSEEADNVRCFLFFSIKFPSIAIDFSTLM